MIHSMTAFARESSTTEQGVLTVELRSVNHRYLDCSFKLPDALRPLEPHLREQATRALARGKLDCLIRLQAHPARSGEWQVDNAQLERLLAAADAIEQQMARPGPCSALEILQFPGICCSPRTSDEELLKEAGRIVRRSLDNLQHSRDARAPSWRSWCWTDCTRWTRK